MRRKGKTMYTPPVILDELEDLMREERINKKADGFKQMVKHCRIGREAERFFMRGYRNKKRLPRVEDYP